MRICLVLTSLLVACAPVPDQLDLGDSPDFDAVLPFGALDGAGQQAPPIDFTQEILTPGEQITFEVTGADPGDTVYFGRSSTGVGAGPCIPSLNICLDIEGPVDLLGVATADFRGEARLRLTLPTNVPAIPVFTQAVAVGPGGVFKSDPLSTVVQDYREDLDGDGYCVGRQPCRNPNDLPGDCNDEDPNVFPDQEEWFVDPMVRQDGVISYDYDCDGLDRLEIFDIYNCAIGIAGICFQWEEAWVNFPSDCGGFGTLGIGCLQTGLVCFPFTVLPAQAACN